MLLPCLYIHDSPLKGRGVFTSEKLAEGILVEASPVLVLSGAERKLLDQTRLHDYIFEWGPRKKECCVALGYLSLYNHSYHSNCEYEMAFDEQVMCIRTVRIIQAGEELTINYNGDWNNTKALWFPAL